MRLSSIFTPICICVGVVSRVLAVTTNGTNMVYGFDSIPTSPDLQWVPCFDDFTCANLEVPIDYEDPTLGTTSIAFIKLRGENATDDAQSILINPGGPGGSGVDMLLTYRANAGPIFGSQYNAISFDPRGVNNSGLVFDCFAGNSAAKTALVRLHTPGRVNASTESIINQYYSATILGEWCDVAVRENSPYGYYVTTPAVVRDMITFIEAEAESIGKPKADAKLWFYGLSYGTIIGTTFASQFPDRVGRMILDGVVDVEQYYTNTWRDNVVQDDEMVNSFAKFCYQAGPNNCLFWGPSAENITNRLDRIMLQLEQEPIPLSGLDTGKLPTLVTVSDLKGYILSAGYEPLVYFPLLADTLVNVERGNVSTLAGVVESFGQFPDADNIIRCADTYTRNKLVTLDAYREYVEFTTSKSRYVGDIYPTSNDIVTCRGFHHNLPDSMTFQGPLPPTSNGTAFPILFASNTIDPITPIVGARKMAEGFPGSVVLTQEAVGHTVANQGGSPCYFNYLHAYLAGTMPPPHVTCPIDRVPFIDGGVMAVVEGT
ncbi:Alpha/Beta hydrolase protein [Hypoxylon trugodes]|uniref:Alpha/Beta hydrolase protein n=1 Tax=Hypoxylon trugodes TaxID=326681 RepID=UPI0021943A8D|nr:Alpha/Beta hydrolase protein [Hypoxylon trugodes]KAI1394350.1 Alpha/Beta hydrolase protein [Hypoxylon trugodes]